MERKMRIKNQINLNLVVNRYFKPFTTILQKHENKNPKKKF